MIQDYLNVVTRTKDLKEEAKNFHRALALIRELGYEVCDPLSVKVDVETPKGKANYVLQNDDMVINLIVGDRCFINDAGAYKLTGDGRVIVYLQINGNNACLDCGYFGIYKNLRLDESFGELKFLYNTVEGKQEFNDIKTYFNDDINELNELLMCIYTSKISQGFMDLLGVTDYETFSNNFHNAMERMKSEGFVQPVQLQVAKVLENDE